MDAGAHRCAAPAARTRTRASRRAARALAQTIADERGRWLLGPHAEARSEYRVRVHSQGELSSHVLDRVFRDEKGERWIVDYKTGTHEGTDLDAFLDRERERYRAQLERYAALLARTESRPTRLALYFPLLQAWREWPAPFATS